MTIPQIAHELPDDGVEGRRVYASAWLGRVLIKDEAGDVVLSVISLSKAQAVRLRDLLNQWYPTSEEPEPQDWCNDCGVPIEGAHGHCVVEDGND